MEVVMLSTLLSFEILVSFIHTREIMNKNNSENGIPISACEKSISSKKRKFTRAKLIFFCKITGKNFSPLKILVFHFLSFAAILKFYSNLFHQ